MAHFILLEIDGDEQRARQVHRELAWAAVKEGWTPRRPQLALEDEAVVSVTGAEDLEEQFRAALADL